MKLLRVLLVTLLVSACGDTIINNGNPAGPPSPGATVSRIEYRVNGNASSVRVRYSNAADGLIQVVTTLPYVAKFNTTETSAFLSLEATPILYPYSVIFPFLSVQIFVDGNLFREASSSDFSLTTVAVNGTWRK